MKVPAVLRDLGFAGTGLSRELRDGWEGDPSASGTCQALLWQRTRAPPNRDPSVTFTGKENGNYRDYRGYVGIIGYILGLYWDNGKENGNYRDYRGYVGIIGYILG